MVLRRRLRARQDDGVVAVLVAALVVGVVLPLMAIVVDLGLTRVLSQRSLGAADAAALAAAAVKPSATDATTVTAAVTAAQTLVAANLPAPDSGWAPAWGSCLDPTPLPLGTAPSPGDCISFDYGLKQVRVTVPARTVPTVFAGFLGSSPPQASATSTASWGDKISPTVGSCGLCVLGSYSSGVERVRVTGGDAAVGTTLTLLWPGGLQVSGGGVTYAGSWSANGGTVSPLPVKRPPPTDPFAAILASLQAAAPYGQAAAADPSGACTPGVYQTISGCTSFGPGTYYVTGTPSTTVQVSLNADASGVLLYFTCSKAGGATGVLAARCPSGTPPRFNGAGTGSRTLSAPAGSGLALVFDQGLARSEFLNSSAQLTINGDVYGHDVTLRPGGTGIAVVHGRVVVQSVKGNLSYFASTMLEVDAPPVTAAGLSNGAVRLVRSS